MTGTLDTGSGRRSAQRVSPRRTRRTALAGLVASAALSAGLLVSGAFAATAPLDTDFRISNTRTDAEVDRDGVQPAVAYNSAANEFLVVWYGDGLATANELEVFGQRVSAEGVELGGDFRISTTGNDGDTDRAVLLPDVAYNSDANEYLVTWGSDDLADNDNEIYGQRVSATGAEVGTDDFRISNALDVGAGRDSLSPAVAYSPAAGEYLVTWWGDGVGTTPGEFEIFGQRVNGAGAEVGTDFRISTAGNNTSSFRAREPDVVFNPTAGEYLVTWWADDVMLPDDFEVYAQRVTAAGAEVGADDFRISTTGVENQITQGVDNPAVAYSPTANEYLVTWESEQVAGNALEIFGQRLSAAGGAVGADDFRISNATDFSPASDAEAPAVAFSPTADEYLVTWVGDGVLDQDFEIFGQRLSGAGVEAGTDFPVSTVGAAVTTDPNTLGDQGPAIAHNPASSQTLVTWATEGLDPSKAEIYGRRVGEPDPPPAATLPAATPPAAKRCKKGSKLKKVKGKKKKKCVKKKKKRKK